LRIRLKGLPKPAGPREGNDGSRRESPDAEPGLQGLAELPELPVPVPLCEGLLDVDNDPVVPVVPVVAVVPACPVPLAEVWLP